MASLLTVIGLMIVMLLLYRRRFTSEMRIGGLYFTQLAYLIFSPVAAAILLNIAFEIVNRPTVTLFPVSNAWLLNLYALTIIIAAIGAAIHSTSTSVYQAFLKDRRIFKNKNQQLKSESFKTNEIFHGSLSHNLSYVGGILASVFLILLELNHPSQSTFWLNLPLLFIIGITMGLVEGIAVLWSGHISYSLVTATISSIFVYIFCLPSLTAVNAYPVAIILTISLVTLSLILVIASFIFIASASLSKRMIKRLFPKNHPIYQSIELTVLRIKIKRDWF